MDGFALKDYIVFVGNTFVWFGGFSVKSKELFKTLQCPDIFPDVFLLLLGRKWQLFAAETVGIKGVLCVVLERTVFITET